MSKDRIWTIGELLDWTARFLAEKGSEFPRLDTEVLLAQALGCRRIELYTRHAEQADPAVRLKFKELIGKRIEGCPVAYLVGRKEFFSLELEVTPAVLIPRPESEFVVMECLERAKELAEQAILDLGTGSGNIAVAVAKRLPTAQVSTVDISPEALEVAKRNAVKHGVADRINFLQGDLFAPLPQDQKFDFVVSNPPYIPSAEIAQLAVGVKGYEPHRALDGGPDGYAVFERIVAGAVDFLKPGGLLILEIGAPQEEPARQKVDSHGGYELLDTVHDYSGHPRVLVARRRST